MSDLLPAGVCVVCFHDGHPDGPCRSMDDNWPPDMTPYPCGCSEYVTEEQRGQIAVTPHVHEYRCSCGESCPHVAALDLIAVEHRECGKPKYDGCFSHIPMPHCRADGYPWPCDVQRLRVAIDGEQSVHLVGGSE